MLKTLATVLLLISTPAFALDREYLGHWIEVSSAPLREVCIDLAGFHITPQGTRTDREQCKVISETRDGTGWKMRFSCVYVEGGKGTKNLRWQMLPDGHLREIENNQTTDFVRCPK
jgi:hypothetical protein